MGSAAEVEPRSLGRTLGVSSSLILTGARPPDEDWPEGQRGSQPESEPAASAEETEALKAGVERGRVGLRVSGSVRGGAGSPREDGGPVSLIQGLVTRAG